MKTLLYILLLFCCLKGWGQVRDTIKIKAVEFTNINGNLDTLCVMRLITEYYFDSTIAELQKQIKELRDMACGSKPERFDTTYYLKPKCLHKDGKALYKGEYRLYSGYDTCRLIKKIKP